MLPEVVLSRGVEGDEARGLIDACPMGVFDMEDGELVVKDSRRCTTCRECLRGTDDSPVILRRVGTTFVFDIESVGTMEPKHIFGASVRILKAKATTLLKGLARLEEEERRVTTESDA